MIRGALVATGDTPVTAGDILVTPGWLHMPAWRCHRDAAVLTGWLPTLDAGLMWGLPLGYICPTPGASLEHPWGTPVSPNKAP